MSMKYIPEPPPSHFNFCRMSHACDEYVGVTPDLMRVCNEFTTRKHSLREIRDKNLDQMTTHGTECGGVNR